MRKWMVTVFVILLLSISVALVVAAAQDLAAYSISWWTVDGGGGTSQGGSYTLSGTAGQPDTGRFSGGAYTLGSGFWQIKPVDAFIYLPLLVR